MMASAPTTMLQIVLRVKAYGGVARIDDYQIEGDKRKRGKALREAVEEGYLTQTGKNYTVTDKVYLNLPSQTPDLCKYWDESRKGWNRESMPFVLFSQLEPAEQRHVLDGNLDHLSQEPHLLDEAAPSAIRLLLVDNKPIQYSSYKFETGSVVACANWQELHDKHKELCSKEGVTGYEPWVIALQSDGLVKHCNKIVGDEKFAYLFNHNLKWGLSHFKLLDEEDAEFFKDDGDVHPLFGGGFGFPAKPDAWTEEGVATRIQGLQNTLETTQRRLTMLKLIQTRMEQLGGWGKFKEQYAAALAEELAKKNAE